MKTYKTLITEFDTNDVVSDITPDTFRSFRKNFKSIERMYPGLNQFLSVANRWVLKGKRFQNKDLKKVLIRMKRRPDISDMNRSDMKRIYKFITKYNLNDIDSVRNVFSDYSDFTKRDNKE